MPVNLYPSLVQRLQALAHHLPHRPARQRARRFIQMSPKIETALARATSREALVVLANACQTVSAIVNTGHLDQDDHSSLSHAFTRLIERNIVRLESRDVTKLLHKICPFLQEDRCGFLQMLNPLLPYLDQSQLKILEQPLCGNPLDASDPYHAQASLDRLHLRRTIASMSGDTALYFTLNAKCPSDDQLMTSRILLEAGRPQEAMQWLDHGMIDRRAFSRSDRLRADILAAQGNEVMAQDLRLFCFRRGLCAHALRDYLKQLPDFDDILAEEDALRFAAGFADQRRSVRFFLDYGRPDLAADRILAEPRLWTAVDTWGQDDAAEDLAPTHPLPASILLRGRVLRILIEDDREMFREARRHLKVLGDLATRAEADNRRPPGYEPHAVWLADLRERMFNSGVFQPKKRNRDAA